MSMHTAEREIKELKAAYGDVSISAGEPAQTLVRIARVQLPAGCRPVETTGLLILQDGQRPLFYVKPGIMLPNGVAPRSTSSVQVAGEEWMQFSYAFQWDESCNTLVQFVETSLRRFAKSE
jgi:hypothetical protein